jgi:hypothetical protein
MLYYVVMWTLHNTRAHLISSSGYMRCNLIHHPIPNIKVPKSTRPCLRCLSKWIHERLGLPFPRRSRRSRASIPDGYKLSSCGNFFERTINNSILRIKIDKRPFKLKKEKASPVERKKPKFYNLSEEERGKMMAEFEDELREKVRRAREWGY